MGNDIAWVFLVQVVFLSMYFLYTYIYTNIYILDTNSITLSYESP